MILPGSYSNGFAPRDGQPLYPELWRGCVGAWNPGLGVSGLSLRDWSGFGNHGTLTNMDAGSDWVTSGGCYALDFDGSNDHVTMGNTTAFNIGAPFSLVAWVRHTMAAASNIISKQQNSSPFTGMGLGTSSAGRFEFFLFSSAGIIVRSPAGHNDGIWRHVVCTYSGGTSVASQQIFVDGVSQSLTTVQNSAPASVITSSALQISGRDGGNNPFLGQVDDARIYNRVLTPNEIRILATRRGIAYEMAPRRRSSSAVAAFNRRRRLLLGAS